MVFVSKGAADLVRIYQVFWTLFDTGGVYMLLICQALLFLLLWAGNRCGCSTSILALWWIRWGCACPWSKERKGGLKDWSHGWERTTAPKNIWRSVLLHCGIGSSNLTRVNVWGMTISIHSC